MGYCSFCEEQEREGYWKSYCVDCAMLRRMLVLHNPKDCVDILRRCLIRNEEQISNKIKIEIKKKSVEINPKGKILETDYNLRSKPKVEKC